MPLESKKQSAEEFHLISQTLNAIPSEATRYIWVLSARHTINKDHNNCPIQSITYEASASSSNSEASCDEEDDLQRMKLGLEMAQQLVAKKANKAISELTDKDYEQHGPSILYNGSPVQNEALRNALQKGLGTLGLPNYPTSKFIIFELPPNQIHTGGQLNALSALIEKDPRLMDLKKGSAESINAEVTIVSSAYHIPRLRRLFNSKVFINPFCDETRITFAGVDRPYVRPCAERDCEGESSRITTYFNKGDIGKPLCSDWYDSASLRNWTPLRNMTGMKHSKFLHSALDLETRKEENREPKTRKHRLTMHLNLD